MKNQPAATPNNLPEPWRWAPAIAGFKWNLHMADHYTLWPMNNERRTYGVEVLAARRLMFWFDDLTAAAHFFKINGGTEITVRRPEQHNGFTTYHDSILN